jgi:hypothetical protein
MLLRVSIEGSTPPTGRVESERGDAVQFAGWMDFLRAVAALVESGSLVPSGSAGDLRASADVELREDVGEMGLDGTS